MRQEPVALVEAVKALAFKLSEEERLALNNFEAKLVSVSQNDEALEEAEAEIIQRGLYSSVWPSGFTAIGQHTLQC